ncbi:MAG: sporulation protein, partial [Clostridia bacterium]|nr:sporulation protein [Clostridia bacterium]
MKKNVFYMLVILTIVLTLIYSESVIRYTREAVGMCMEVIIPTLFPFFVCSGLLIWSGFGSVLARAAATVMRPLFNVAPSGAAAFVLGVVSGFPLGATTTADLYRCGSLSRSEAERLLAFCNNSGPLFIIGTIGSAVYGRPIYGAVLYVIHIISSIFVGMIFSQYKKERHNSPPLRLVTNEMPLSEVFTTALS